jgi:uncharacterized coiled-coil protein SlyX
VTPDEALAELSETWAFSSEQENHLREILVKVAEEKAKEVERCHDALDQIYDHLVILESSLPMVEQVLLCPVDLCKWRKHPEWEERYEHGQTEEGKEQRKTQLQARIDRLRAKLAEKAED